MDRREFTALLPALLALLPEATAQQPAPTPLDAAMEAMQHPTIGQPIPGIGATKGLLTQLTSGVFNPGTPSGSSGRVGRRYVAGILKAGNIQIEMHETRQEPGTPHEAIGKHLHSEIWLVREGICELTTAGVTRRMVAGDVGLCVAGDLHYVRNAGDVPCQYFVVTVGPPES